MLHSPFDIEFEPISREGGHICRMLNCDNDAYFMAKFKMWSFAGIFAPPHKIRMPVCGVHAHKHFVKSLPLLKAVA